jgi:pSer/pThr/pTyr-binding forkhead associated (FHA) protein
LAEIVLIEEWPIPGKRRTLKPGMTIGRAGCEIVLLDPEVSRRHAIVRELDSSLAIEDLDSHNGTFINEERISGITELHEGDTIRFGKTVWRFESATAG